MGQIKYGKLVIIGAGHVGSAILNSVVRLNLMEDIVVINRNRERALGEVMDASHTLAFAYSVNTTIRVGGYEECADAQIIVNTAGPSIPPGSKDRMALLHSNVQVMNDIMGEITKHTREAIIINVSNPVDILTYTAQKKFGYPADKILSTGTILDTARFNKMLGDICGVDSKNVTGFVLGEHGHTSFVPWHTVNICGIPFEEFERQFEPAEHIDKEKLLHDVKNSGLEILRLKGYTSSGIALSVCRLIGSIIRNEKAVLPVSVVMEGQYGLSGVAMSLPCIISKKGIERILELPLDAAAHKDLMLCYDYLHGNIESVKDML